MKTISSRPPVNQYKGHLNLQSHSLQSSTHEIMNTAFAYNPPQMITHSKSQHDLSEVLVSYNSLLNSFDWISGPGEKIKTKFAADDQFVCLSIFIFERENKQ